MAAAVLTGVREMELREVPKPQCRLDNLVLKVEACGVCGTDLRTYRHGDPRAAAPWILGHEVAGVVVEIGREAAREVSCKEGDRVVVISTVPCGTCFCCRTGRENLCENSQLLGYAPLQGAYAEYLSVEPVVLKNIRPIPKDLPFDLAALLDPLSCAINGMQKLDVKMGNRVVILGAGPIGTMQAAIASNSGASRVVVVDVLQARLDFSRKVNGNSIFHYCLSTGKGEMPEVMDLLEGEGADRVIVACSSHDAQEQALFMAGRRARVCYFGGLPRTRPSINFMSNELHYKELEIVGAYASTYEQQLLAMDMITERRINAEELTASVALENLVQTFRKLDKGKFLQKAVALPWVSSDGSGTVEVESSDSRKH